MSLSRRSLLGMGVAGAATAGLSLALPGRLAAADRKRPKNVIFCVADGMAIQTMSMADQFQKLLSGRSSYWRTLMNEEYAHSGLQETRSLNSLVTDSSAASSAWGSGRHIWNGQVNEFPDGTKLRTLVSLLTEAKVRCGLVTTTTITHATPAGFAVNCMQRDLEGLIAERYLEANLEVLMGGGDKFFNPKVRKDGRDVYADFAKAGYTVARTRHELMEAKGGRLLGVFSDGHTPYSVDRNNDPLLQMTVPTLAEMASTAIDRLKGGPNGFLLQIEGGRVDHGGHGNDLAALVYDQIAFEEAVKVAVDFALSNGETLVVITTDHACGGPSLNGAGHEYGDTPAGLKTLAGMKGSYSEVWKAIGTPVTADKVREGVQAKLGIALTAAEAEAVAQAAEKNSPFAVQQFYGSSGATLAMVLGNHSKVTWTSGNHTSEHCLVTAVGPWSERFMGLHPNITFFDWMLEAWDLKWNNPTMSYEEAVPFYDKLKEKLPPEFVFLYTAEDECGCGLDHTPWLASR